MKIAIALFGSRVSPRFDCAPRFRIVETDDGEIRDTKEIDTDKCDVIDRIKKLAESGVDTLICGGIDGFSVSQLDYHGIKIYSWITGQADDALNCLLKGQLESGFMMAPGGRCGGRWRLGCNPRRGRGRGERRSRRRQGPSSST